MLQMRPTDGPMGAAIGVKYAPARDLVYLYPNIVAAAEELLYKPKMPFLRRLISEYDVENVELADAVRTFCLALNEAHKYPNKPFDEVLDDVGFMYAHPVARIALMYHIGTLCAGTFFQGIRDVVAAGDDTIPPVKRLLQTAQDAREYMDMGPIRGLFWRFKRRWFPKKYACKVD